MDSLERVVAAGQMSSGYPDDTAGATSRVERLTCFVVVAIGFVRALVRQVGSHLRQHVGTMQADFEDRGSGDA